MVVVVVFGVTVVGASVVVVVVVGLRRVAGTGLPPPMLMEPTPMVTGLPAGEGTKGAGVGGRTTSPLKNKQILCISLANCGSVGKADT